MSFHRQWNSSLRCLLVSWISLPRNNMMYRLRYTEFYYDCEMFLYVNSHYSYKILSPLLNYNTISEDDRELYICPKLHTALGLTQSVFPSIPHLDRKKALTPFQPALLARPSSDIALHLYSCSCLPVPRVRIAFFYP